MNGVAERTKEERVSQPKGGQTKSLQSEKTFLYPQTARPHSSLALTGETVLVDRVKKIRTHFLQLTIQEKSKE